ncbi:uncharacterized protein LOC122257110 [Penaeus japonicus]|uniref:uncharacterized protein LOC122257110 n=1 Tax=Penaeus japonicus TaxID=27405 RepID=UPI001C7149E8|nr:uncharacterized protein LOC122257110 [Penaeus japonicus]
MDKRYRILLHSEKSIASIETISTESLRDSHMAPNVETPSEALFQSAEGAREQIKQVNPQSKEPNLLHGLVNDGGSNGVLRLMKNPVTGKLTLMCHSAVGAPKENIDIEKNSKQARPLEISIPTGGQHTDLLSIGRLRAKRGRGRPRKDKALEVKEEDEDDKCHTCTRVVQTNSRTVYLKGECNCLEEQTNDEEESDVEEKEELVRVNTVDRPNANKRKNIEGNIDIREYVSASSRIRDPYRPWRKNYDMVDGREVLPEYKIQAIERNKRQKEMRLNQKHSVFRTWESVLACKDRVEEETRSKYNLYSKTPGFCDDRPKPGKRVLFELKRSKGDSAVVPYTGVPLMWIGSRVYTCHLSKHNYKYEARRHKEESEGSCGNKSKKKKITPSKHIGCPATFSVTKVARFPDFEVTDESRCKTTVSAELRNAWLQHPEKVRYYIEYYVKRPKMEDHQGHFSEDAKISAKFQEPVDPRILRKIHSLTQEGVAGVKQVKEALAVFVRDELFRNCEPPSPERRRYNPSSQDIRNAMKKARLELQRAGKSILQIQCNKLVRDIGDLIGTLSNEEYLAQLKNHLTNLQSTLREGTSMEPYLACIPSTKDPMGLPKKNSISSTQDFTVAAEVKERTPHYTYSLSETEQATQVLYQEELHREPDIKMDEGVTQIYYYHQINPGEEVYTTEVVDTSMQQ